MSTTIQITNLSVSYERKRVLSNIYLQIKSGKIYGIIGPNGAGKSTLFKAILDLVPINSGEIEIMGSTIDEHKKDVVYIPQKDDIDWAFPARVIDIVMMGRYPHKNLLQQMSKHDYDIADKALHELGIEALRNRQIGNLSGGQQQRVFIARALAQESSILLFDEPFVGIDQTTEEKIISVLQKLAEENRTVLVIHHDLSTVRNYFHHVVMINQRLIAEGPCSTTFNDDNINKTFRGQLNFLHETNV